MLRRLDKPGTMRSQCLVPATQLYPQPRILQSTTMFVGGLPAGFRVDDQEEPREKGHPQSTASMWVMGLSI